MLGIILFAIATGRYLVDLVDRQPDHEVGEQDGDEDDEHGEEEDGEGGVRHVEAGRDARVGDAGAEHVAEVDLADHHHHRLERREGRVREHLLLGERVDESDLVTLFVRGIIRFPKHRVTNLLGNNLPLTYISYI